MPLERAPAQAEPEFMRVRIDTYLGMGASNVVAFFIIMTTAATGGSWQFKRGEPSFRSISAVNFSSTPRRAL
ncbi:hypothetical protein CPY51_06950 [Rhizobium tubonense]|uniref:Uncharacterized protein n=1 Tax=Rhizobium tubonense TaxID=484088 RepID=A0A2W4EPX8_9HYPH|nr:hypothetical protein CPY51_06950 [Rhizobium tubonense]